MSTLGRALCWVIVVNAAVGMSLGAGDSGLPDPLYDRGPYPPPGPKAYIYAPYVAECNQPGGAMVYLDGSSSRDSYGGMDIVAYDWFLDPGLATQRLIGRGATVEVFLALGTRLIGLRIRDTQGEVDLATTSVQVRDTVPPSLTLTLSPTTLWPPNHRMVPIRSSALVTDVCDPASIAVLSAARSNEPDDDPGSTDGNTTADVQEASAGAPEDSVLLRAERSGDGPGRTYTLTYAARDASGNTAAALGFVTVPHDQGTGPEPVMMSLEGSGTAGRTRLFWKVVSGADSYDLVQGSLDQVTRRGGVTRLGPVRVLASGTAAPTYTESTTDRLPETGKAFFYLAQYRIGGIASGWGTESSPWPAEPTSCDAVCPGSETGTSIDSGERLRR